MTTIPNSTTPLHHRIPAARRRHPKIHATSQPQESPIPRRKIVTSFLIATTSSIFGPINAALAQNWGTRSFIFERYFQPGLSPEDAATRIQQTAEGLHELRHMLETMSWKYVMMYIRLKQAYLSQDMTTAMSTVPESRRGAYVQTANELVDNMREFDSYIRTPKVYESYLYYEKTLKSIDELVAFFG